MLILQRSFKSKIFLDFLFRLLFRIQLGVNNGNVPQKNVLDVLKKKLRLNYGKSGNFDRGKLQTSKKLAIACKLSSP